MQHMDALDLELDKSFFTQLGKLDYGVERMTIY